jgi:capsule polysaccharide export protein KpsE/RkpR
MEITKDDAIRARDTIWQARIGLAKASSDKSYLKEFLKSKLAILMSESTEPTMSGKEMYAKSHEDYIELLDGIRIAEYEEIKLKWEMESAKITVEIYRTESANNRTIDRATH